MEEDINRLQKYGIILREFRDYIQKQINENNEKMYELETKKSVDGN